MTQETIDDDIIDIFIEEAEEVIGDLDNHLPKWQENPGDKAIRTEIRRSFHTLKGSGRMVNATDIADLSWNVENMLNRTIEGGLGVSSSMVELVDGIRQVLPSLIDSFRHNRDASASGVDLALLNQKLERLSKGESMEVQEPAVVNSAVPDTATESATPAPDRPAEATPDPDLSGKLADLGDHLRKLQAEFRETQETVQELSGNLIEWQKEGESYATRVHFEDLTARIKAQEEDIKEQRAVIQSLTEHLPANFRKISNESNEKIARLERRCQDISKTNEDQLERLRNSPSPVKSCVLAACLTAATISVAVSAILHFL